MKNSVKTKLRIRFVVFSLAALLLLISAIVSASLLHSYNELVEKSDVILSQVRQNPGVNVRYFSVKIHPGKSSVRLDTVQHVQVSHTQAADLSLQAIRSGKDKGFIDGYRYHIYRNEEGIRVLFLSRHSSLEMHRQSASSLILISCLGLLLTAVVLIPVSGWVVAPIAENHRRQKQFITAASHALKTPLSVISADAQLLQTEIGDNQWVTGILDQVDHLNKMTQGLVQLSKAEEYHNPVDAESFSFTQLIEQTLDAYKPLLDSKQISVSAQFPANLSYKGSYKELHQLLTLLLDNAAKYCPQGGQLRIVCKAELRGLRLQLENTADISPNQDLTQRFVRGSNAANAEGFGLGLSVSQAIAFRHKGNLTVSVQKDGSFLAEVTLR